MSETFKSPRVDVVDALRGFAILSIMLLHNLEHFDLYNFPVYFPTWLKALDSKIWNTMFFLFSGKSYAIFALLFGFTFFIQQNNQEQKGADFRKRFLWRMLLLLGFGFVNTCFYQGDILTTYAILGISLVPVCKLSNKAVLIISIILLLQPIEWAKFFYLISHPLKVFPMNISYQYFGRAEQYQGKGSFLQLVYGNLTNGKLGVAIWTVESGRFFQAPALFMMGMLLGRKSLLVSTVTSLSFWKRTLMAAACLFFSFSILKANLSQMGFNKMQMEILTGILSSLSNFGFTFVLVSGFWLLYQKAAGEKILSKLNPFGRMTLTNYIVQSMMGSFVYYGYGLGLYKYTGATYCLLIGITLFCLQAYLCKWWLKNHKQGPLENLWHKATWINSK